VETVKNQNFMDDEVERKLNQRLLDAILFVTFVFLSPVLSETQKKKKKKKK
jgi:hypothetical protein